MRRLGVVFGVMLILGGASAQAQNYTMQVNPPVGGEANAEPHTQENAATPEAGNPLAPIKHSEDDLVVIDITSGGQTIAQGLTGYATKGGLLLPLGQLSDALEFPIRVSLKDGTAAGWFYREDNEFSLNIGHGEVIVGGNRQKIDPRFVELQQDDIYIDTTLLTAWFSVDFNFKFSDLTVEVVPHKGVKLPFELANDNNKRRQQLNKRPGMDEKAYPVKKLPYALASSPFVDVNSQTSYEDKRGRQTTSALATNDLLYMHNDTFINVEDATVADLRVTLSRRSAEGKLFSDDEKISQTKLGEISNELQLREVAFGDIYSSQLPLSGRNQGGRGVTVSNQPTDRATQYNMTTLEGDILPNWDVELYRNNELLNYQQASSNGHYEFQDVPLLSGTNIIRLVFYGPHGETREETRQILVRSDLTKKGESYFRATAMQQDNSLLQVREAARTNLSQGVGQTPSELDAVKGKMRSSLEYEYGLVDNLALYTSAVMLPTGDGEDRRYLTTGLGTSLFGIYGRADTSLSDGNGHAYQGLLQTNYYGVTLSARHQYFVDYLSDYTGNITDPLKQVSEIRADTPLDISWIPTLNMGVSNTWNDYTSGRRENELAQRLSMYVMRGLYLSHELRLRNTNNAGGGSLQQKDGLFTLSTPVWGVQVRGSVGYDIAPDSGISNAQLGGDYFINNDFSLHGDINHQVQSDITTYNAGFARHFDKILVGINGSYDTDRGIGAFLNVGFSFGQNIHNRDWEFYPDNTARNGAVYARAYLDRNNNHVFDEGDEPIPKATFNSASGGRALTDENGVAFLQGLRTESGSNIELEEDTLDNAYWVVKDPGFAVSARPGSPAVIDFAVVESGDIDGDTTLLEDGKIVVASNVMLQLVDPLGNVVRETRSSFDGYYLFDRVAVGNYILRVSPDQLRRKNLESSVDVRIEMKAEGAIRQNFTLMPLPEGVTLPPLPEDNQVAIEN